jgi:tetraacyldisaccharide 4'-kinase
VPLYAAGLRLQDALRRQPKRLQKPVVSVGSLSAGGAGKTPVVLALAALLQQHGIRADVLSRGYGRGSCAIERVDAAGRADRFGDEPLELAQAGLEVYVGSGRHAAGCLAEAQGSAMVHLLDDGFQHRGVARNLDLVLLTREDVDDHLLPAGNLREPLRALCRASVILLRDNEADLLKPFVARRTQAPVWIIHRGLRLPADVPTQPLAFCGIARPAGFFAMLRDSGCFPVGAHAFPDHHPYTHEDIQQLLAASEHAGANGFVTTTKDAVKLTPTFRDLLSRAGDLGVAQLQVTFADEKAVCSTLSSLWPVA